MNRVRVPTRYLVEYHTLIEQVEILMQTLLQFEIYLIERRIIIIIIIIIIIKVYAPLGPINYANKNT